MLIAVDAFNIILVSVWHRGDLYAFTSASLVQAGFVLAPQRVWWRSLHWPDKEREEREVQTEWKRYGGEEVLTWVTGLCGMQWRGEGLCPLVQLLLWSNITWMDEKYQHSLLVSDYGCSQSRTELYHVFPDHNGLKKLKWENLNGKKMYLAIKASCYRITKHFEIHET